jgi:hypothetical protein
MKKQETHQMRKKGYLKLGRGGEGRKRGEWREGWKKRMEEEKGMGRERMEKEERDREQESEEDKGMARKRMEKENGERGKG